MNKDHIKGAFDIIMGAVKGALGAASGDSKMQDERKMDKEKGEARKSVGDMKEASTEAVE